MLYVVFLRPQFERRLSLSEAAGTCSSSASARLLSQTARQRARAVVQSPDRSYWSGSPSSRNAEESRAKDLSRVIDSWAIVSFCGGAAAQLGVEIDGPPSLFPPAEPAAASRICTASRHLHRHYTMRRKRRAARRRPPSGGPQFNVKTLGGLRDASRPRDVGAVVRRFPLSRHFDSWTWCLP